MLADLFYVQDHVQFLTQTASESGCVAIKCKNGQDIDSRIANNLGGMQVQVGL